MAAAEEIAHSIYGYTVVLTKSTVPVGTNRKIRDIVAATNPQVKLDVASNPEFLREGAAIGDSYALTGSLSASKMAVRPRP
ncbi:UDP-glucose 6-dehydrogenase TuaD [Ruegeria atlantica]|uniref:UDP-glucose 6-dehydrogenase n=1 Tax=Ruegeria atlantica TaxID=81569 RepID=A0A0P1EMG0_9RHOB|nr:UDP-glucose 6-dehydrogenase TuaD [Ruegeria atlantica]